MKGLIHRSYRHGLFPKEAVDQKAGDLQESAEILFSSIGHKFYIDPQISVELFG